MTRLIRSELRKTTSTRTLRTLVGVPAVLVAVVGVLQLLLGDTATGGLQVQGMVSDIRTAADYRDFVSTAAALGPFFAITAGVLAATSESRYATWVRTVLATPQRSRVVVAKIAVALTTGATIGLASAATAALVGAAWVVGHGRSVPITADVAASIAQLTLACALDAAAGTAVGVLIRSQAAAFAVTFGWVFLGESLLVGLVADIKRWLPFTGAGQALLSGPTERLFPPWGGGLLLAGYAVGLAVLAAWALRRRDVG